jgi:hypothetical protein
MSQSQSQASMILAALKAGSVIDPMRALRTWGCARLASRILELRQAGYRIETRRVKVRTRAGYAFVALYRMEPGQA